MKGLITGMTNEEEHIYMSINAKKSVLKILEKFLLDLDLDARYFISDYDPKTGEETEKTYSYNKKLIDKHLFIRNNKYQANIIFGPKRMHIIILANKKNKENLKKTILKHFKFASKRLPKK